MGIYIYLQLGRRVINLRIMHEISGIYHPLRVLLYIYRARILACLGSYIVGSKLSQQLSYKISSDMSSNYIADMEAMKCVNLLFLKLYGQIQNVYKLNI
jgi:hypothetical protein